MYFCPNYIKKLVVVVDPSLRHSSGAIEAESVDFEDENCYLSSELVTGVGVNDRDIRCRSIIMKRAFN